jgi:peptidoglycan-associated lipoprotein
MNRNSVVVSTLVVALLGASCAKQPAATTASAPSPAVPSPSSSAASTSAAAPTAAGKAGAGSATQGTRTAATAGAQASSTPSTAAPRQEPRQFVPVRALPDIHFEYDKYDIRPADARVLDAGADWLNTNRGYLVLIEGHCDERGTNEYNLSLGERRAQSAMNYLVARGVAASRISIVSYGEERAVCAEHTESCWAKNRRAHFRVKAQ